MADMRLFHHFLITAYPHLPVGADKIWITVIPSFAHNVGCASSWWRSKLTRASMSTLSIQSLHSLHLILMLYRLPALPKKQYRIE